MKLFYGMIIALSAFFPAGCGNSGGADSLVYHIDLPAGVRAFLALYPIDAPGTSHEINLSPDAGKTASGSLPALAPGSYLTVIDLYDAAGNRAPAPVEEVVSVSSGLPLTLSRGFTASGFSGCDPLAGQGASTLAAKLDAALASAPGKYTVLVDGTETDLASFAPKTLHGKGNRTITLRGGGHQVQAGAAGTPLFTIEAGSGSTLTLVLRDIALKGRDGNTVPVIRVNAGGKLAMKTGALISGNTSVDDGNVRIYADSPMSPMNPGGGVVLHDGTLEMSGGVISGNTAHDGGGGVVLYDGIFAMSGGAIRGNTAYGDGGGVIVYAGTLEMSGGAISGNTASHGGGGVLVVDGGVMNIRGGAISGNTASPGGGGVTVFDGIFGMSGGTISGNTGETGGGVLIVDNGTFQMSGGAISGNTAHDSGGGVVLYDGIFAMNGGA
ncbi:MAG: hypothetical protein LBP27_06305, partial [Treponema sp.]|nr:hypothetical protein [Treponema sp.]